MSNRKTVSDELVYEFPYRILAILPCYNEMDSISAVLDELQSVDMKIDTLVIDDGSSDQTYALARERSYCAHLSSNSGIGSAVQTGIIYAYRKDYRFCLQIDGDGQHPPDQISKLIEAYQSTSANIVIGSRYVDRQGFQSTWTRRFGSMIISKALGTLYHDVRITDPTSGLRLLDRRAISLFAKQYPPDFPEPISLAWALGDGLRVVETPVMMRSRESGVSSIAGLKTLSYMVRVLAYIALARLRARYHSP